MTCDNDEMVRGYMAGLKSVHTEMTEWVKRQSVAYRHGWLNGRDDRIGNPRDFADVLRRRANIINQSRGEA